VVHQLDRGRPEFEARGQGVERRGEAGELRHQQTATLRLRDDVQVRFRDDR
jgi:hypothetical protein